MSSLLRFLSSATEIENHSRNTQRKNDPSRSVQTMFQKRETRITCLKYVPTIAYPRSVTKPTQKKHFASNQQPPRGIDKRLLNQSQKLFLHVVHLVLQLSPHYAQLFFKVKRIDVSTSICSSQSHLSRAPLPEALLKELPTLFMHGKQTDDMAIHARPLTPFFQSRHRRKHALTTRQGNSNLTQ